ncbi:MAG: TetR/AcrR family transcriptional regulator [Phycisphaerales bacterium]|nr:TetR/AcrR family transcriptional regulator [Phycisphaerales bacterium]
MSGAATTKDRLIRTAHDLFYREGFHAVGLDRILDAVGVTKTTFYNHFESKDDLMLEALRRHDRWWRDEFVAMLRKHGGDSAKGQLLAAADALEDILAEDGFNGCIFVNVAVQYPQPHEPAHVLAAEHKRLMEDVLRGIAGYAGADDAKALAKELAMALEGAFVTRQVTGDPDTARVAGSLVRMIVERRCGEA